MENPSRWSRCRQNIFRSRNNTGRIVNDCCICISSRRRYKYPPPYPLQMLDHKKRGCVCILFFMVEVTGLEPAASCSQSRHSSQTELHLDRYLILFVRRCCFARPLAKSSPQSNKLLDARFCCASSSSLHLSPAAVAFVTQSRHSSQTELHLDRYLILFVRRCCFARPLAKSSPQSNKLLDARFCCASSSSLHLPPAAVTFVTQSRHSSQTELHLDNYYMGLCPLVLKYYNKPVIKNQ